MRSSKFLFLSAFICLSVPLLAHKGRKHPGRADSPLSREAVLRRIDALYGERVKSIFQKKCFDCHGVGNPLPWYSSIPGARHLIQRDIRVAKEHMDMSRDFPFGGHGSPMEDLESLEGVLENGLMPPLRYRVMHWGSGLSEADIEIIRGWLNEGRTLLAEGR